MTVHDKPHDSQMPEDGDMHGRLSADGEPVVAVQKLRKTYGDITAVAIDQVEVAAGECVGVVGNNGAGKTTLLRLILDLVAADQGRVLIDGEPVHGSAKWKMLVGSYLDEGFLPGFLMPREYLCFVGGFYSRRRSQVEKELPDYFDLVDEDVLTGRKHIRNLSSGTRKKIGLISALMHSTRLLVLDEPFSGLDPTSQLVLAAKLRSKFAQGVAVLLSSHDLVGVTELCSRILLLDEGRILRQGATSAETLSDLKSYFTSQQTSRQMKRRTQ